MKKLTLFLFLSFIFLTPSVLNALHIIGGEITYKFLRREGDRNQYQFTMKIYRDGGSMGAPFDQLAQMGAFAKSSNTLVQQFSTPLSESNNVVNPNPPCSIPSRTVVVQEGIYVWELSLPIINDSYIIAYQRCCRNTSINNINRPGEAGATYSVEITAQSQQLGNSSPTFKFFPPTIICANEPINFDHSATDAEGDQIVYRFCEPLNGGGQRGSGPNQPPGSATGCDGTSPNPPCYPPSSTISFKIPTYSFSRPLAGNPLVQINSTTGFITGVPEETGQFVVSVCAEEYRNGQLLSVLRRDFQFNVQSCKPIIQAKVQADSVRDKVYYIFQCGDRRLSITNLSLDRSAVKEFSFNIDLKNEQKYLRNGSR
ncbi:MAG: hypothetical protein HC817_08890 [Saprospiraceae bacterium]|nr:hypothetical protein [Saprospiraceae bacterium]